MAGDRVTLRHLARRRAQLLDLADQFGKDLRRQKIAFYDETVAVEALTVSDGRIHSEMREVVVPPEKRVLNVEVLPSQQEFKPGQKVSVKVKLTDFFGNPQSEIRAPFGGIVLYVGATPAMSQGETMGMIGEPRLER